MEFDILSNLIISKVNSVTTMYSEQSTKAKRNHRYCWGIVIKYEGATVYEAKGKTYRSDANHLVILPKGCSYEWNCIEAGHYGMIDFECDIVCDEIFRFPVDNSEKILKLFKELEYKRTLRKPLNEVESIRDTYSILLMMTQTMAKKYLPTEKHNKISPALDYIAKNYNQNIKNEDLARLTGLSEVYFRKLFTDVVGVSPVSYIQNLRIKKAKEMLKSDYGSITNIAQTLGYLNIYDFSRAFKKYVGISPLKYKKQLHIQ